MYSGNAAPLEKNLAKYLKAHPECEVYVPGQHNDYIPSNAGTPLQMATTMPSYTTQQQVTPTYKVAQCQQVPQQQVAPQQQLSPQQPQYELPYKPSMEDPWMMEVERPGDLFLHCTGSKSDAAWDGWEQQLCCMPATSNLDTKDFDFSGLDNFMASAFVPPVSCLHYMETCFHPGTGQRGTRYKVGID